MTLNEIYMERYSYTDMAHDDDLKRMAAEIDELKQKVKQLERDVSALKAKG